MGWSVKRIEQFRLGANPNLFELYLLDHAHPFHMFLALLALVLLFIGLWTHDIMLIGLNCAIGASGHLFCWLQK